MARYVGPVCRLCRREGKKLFLKGDRCYSAKCAIEKRNVPPGQHGQTRAKLSTYGVQLREKQRAKRIYGVLEKQFRRSFANASRLTGVTGTVLLQLLERRLDNVVFRAGYASSRAAARQFVRHGHVRLNGSKADIPSMLVRPGDVVVPTDGAKAHKALTMSLSQCESRGRKPWLQYDSATMAVKFVSVPSRQDLDDIDIREQLIIELYSK